MENQRVRLSKTLLKNALIALLQEKEIHKITVYEICSLAQINRTTFYKYYGSQYDLLNEIENDLLCGVEAHLSSGSAFGVDVLERALEYLISEQEKCRALLNTVSDRCFPERLFGLPTIRAILDESLPKDLTPAQLAYVSLFFCQGGYAVIRRWLNNQCRESPAEMSALIYSLRSSLFSESLDKLCTQK